MKESFQPKKMPFEIASLLNPSKAFRHPLDVVADPDMTIAEKRSVLASWASDACATESNPALRTPATGSIVSYDEIIDALQSLDVGQPADKMTDAFKRRRRRRRWSDWKNRKRGGPDSGDIGSGAFN